MKKGVVLTALMLILLCTSVMGISLKSYVLDLKLKKIGTAWVYEPGYSFSSDYIISNYNYGKAEPYLTGDLAEYATIRNIETFDDHVDFSVDVALPDELEPGDHLLYIGAREKAGEEDGGMMTLVAKAQKVIVFKSLYDEKVAVFKGFSTPDVNENEKTNFTFTAESQTKQAITGITGNIKIYNFDDELVKTIKIEPFSLESAEVKSIKTEFDSTGLVSGEYSATAEINLEEKTTELKSIFNIGQLNIIALNFTRNFTAGQINKVGIDVRSEWNGRPEFFAELYIDNELQTTTQTYTIEPFETKRITGFLDLSSFEGGEYDFKIILKFASQSSELEESITIQGEKSKGLSITLNTTTIIAVLAIIVVLLIIFILFQQRNSKKGRK